MALGGSAVRDDLFWWSGAPPLVLLFLSKATENGGALCLTLASRISTGGDLLLQIASSPVFLLRWFLLASSFVVGLLLRLVRVHNFQALVWFSVTTRFYRRLGSFPIKHSLEDGSVSKCLLPLSSPCGLFFVCRS